MYFTSRAPVTASHPHRVPLRHAGGQRRSSRASCTTLIRRCTRRTLLDTCWSALRQCLTRKRTTTTCRWQHSSGTLRWIFSKSATTHAGKRCSGCQTTLRTEVSQDSAVICYLHAAPPWPTWYASIACTQLLLQLVEVHRMHEASPTSKLSHIWHT